MRACNMFLRWYCYKKKFALLSALSHSSFGLLPTFRIHLFIISHVFMYNLFFLCLLHLFCRLRLFCVLDDCGGYLMWGLFVLLNMQTAPKGFLKKEKKITEPIWRVSLILLHHLYLLSFRSHKPTHSTRSDRTRDRERREEGLYDGHV